MVKVTLTNIIVDEFSTATYHPKSKYVHFLTHIHTGTSLYLGFLDHLKGLTNSWDYGPIYCSKITKDLILLKFPSLKCLLDIQHVIPLSEDLEVTVTLFDSNHCAGGTMMLIEGFMGRILYSGDMRFDKQIFSSYNYLYPHARRNKQFSKCAKEIDFLYLDITFLHPKFTFPPKTEALRQLQNHIQESINKAKAENGFVEFYIGMDTFGKEEILVHLAEKFQTYITVTEQRYKNILTIGLSPDIFSTDPKKGFIHVVLKNELNQIVKGKENSMGIILTGWANEAHWRGPKIYAIPYSLHSSYPELCQFVDSIRPTYLESIIDIGPVSRKSEQSTNSLSSKSNNLYEPINYHEYLNKLRIDYSSPISKQLEELMTNTELQQRINKKLRLQHLNDPNPGLMSKSQMQKLKGCNQVANIEKAGARLSTNSRNEEQIQRVKETLKIKKDNYLKMGMGLGMTKRKRVGSSGLFSKNFSDNKNSMLDERDQAWTKNQRMNQSEKYQQSQQNLLKPQKNMIDLSYDDEAGDFYQNDKEDKEDNDVDDDAGNVEEQQSCSSNSIHSEKQRQRELRRDQRLDNLKSIIARNIQINQKKAENEKENKQFEQSNNNSRQPKNWKNFIENGEIDLFGDIKPKSAVLNGLEVVMDEERKGTLEKEVIGKGKQKHIEKQKKGCLDDGFASHSVITAAVDTLSQNLNDLRLINHQQQNRQIEQPSTSIKCQPVTYNLQQQQYQNDDEQTANGNGNNHKRKQEDNLIRHAYPLQPENVSGRNTAKNHMIPIEAPITIRKMTASIPFGKNRPQRKQLDQQEKGKNNNSSGRSQNDESNEDHDKDASDDISLGQISVGAKRKMLAVSNSIKKEKGKHLMVVNAQKEKEADKAKLLSDPSKANKRQSAPILIEPVGPYQHVLDSSEPSSSNNVSDKQTINSGNSSSGQKSLTDYKWFRKTNSQQKADLESLKQKRIESINQGIEMYSERERQNAMELQKKIQKQREQQSSRLQIQSTKVISKNNASKSSSIIQVSVATPQNSSKHNTTAQSKNNDIVNKNTEKNVYLQHQQVHIEQEGQTFYKNKKTMMISQSGQKKKSLVISQMNFQAQDLKRFGPNPKSCQDVGIEDIDMSYLQQVKEVTEPKDYWKFFTKAALQPKVYYASKREEKELQI